MWPLSAPALRSSTQSMSAGCLEAIAWSRALVSWPGVVTWYPAASRAVASGDRSHAVVFRPAAVGH